MKTVSVLAFFLITVPVLAPFPVPIPAPILVPVSALIPVPGQINLSQIDIRNDF